MIGFDVAFDDVRFVLFNVISGSWAHVEELEAVEMLGACADCGAPVKLVVAYVVEDLGRAFEDLLGSASYHFINSFKGCDLDSGSILTDSEMDSNYHDIASPSYPDLTCYQIINCHID